MGRVSGAEYRGVRTVETHQALFVSIKSAGSIADQDHPTTTESIRNVVSGGTK